MEVPSWSCCRRKKPRAERQKVRPKQVFYIIHEEKKMATVLVVEDDENTRILTTARLKPYYTVLAAENGQEAIDLFYESPVDLIVTDVMMPVMDGYELVRTLRDYKQDVPVIFLTAKDSFEDKREGFASGIDDYMTKPFRYEELLWRIEALLRRANIESSRTIKAGASVLDQNTYTVTDGTGNEVQLPAKEFDLLFLLLSSPGQIFTKQQILDKVWGMDTGSDDSTVKTHINRLRNRFEGNPDFEIVTVRGLGYKGMIHT